MLYIYYGLHISGMLINMQSIHNSKGSNHQSMKYICLYCFQDTLCIKDYIYHKYLFHSRRSLRNQPNIQHILEDYLNIQCTTYHHKINTHNFKYPFWVDMTHTFDNWHCNPNNKCQCNYDKQLLKCLNPFSKDIEYRFDSLKDNRDSKYQHRENKHWHWDHISQNIVCIEGNWLNITYRHSDYKLYNAQSDFNNRIHKENYIECSSYDPDCIDNTRLTVHKKCIDLWLNSNHNRIGSSYILLHRMSTTSNQFHKKYTLH